MTLDPKQSNTEDERLRCRPVEQPFHIVLVEPEIPPNTGNIARLCAATSSPLHLVGKLGFRIDEHSVRRAGVDYWHLVDVRAHADFSHFLSEFAERRWTPAIAMGGANAHNAPTPIECKLHLFSATAERSY